MDALISILFISLIAAGIIEMATSKHASEEVRQFIEMIRSALR